MNDKSMDVKVFSAMQEDTPVASYRKTILGKVFVNILDPFTGNPTGLILKGEPNSEDARVDVWTTKENLFLQRMNRKHFETGVLQKVDVRVSTPIGIAYSDEELKDILNLVYISLKKRLVEMTDPATLQRMVSLADEMEKSVKIKEAVEGRLKEVLSVEG